jgi:hypothetical protein
MLLSLKATSQKREVAHPAFAPAFADSPVPPDFRPEMSVLDVRDPLGLRLRGLACGLQPLKAFDEGPRLLDLDVQVPEHVLENLSDSIEDVDALLLGLRVQAVAREVVQHVDGVRLALGPQVWREKLGGVVDLVVEPEAGFYGFDLLEFFGREAVLLRRLCEDVQHVVDLVLDYPPQIGHNVAPPAKRTLPAQKAQDEEAPGQS